MERNQMTKTLKNLLLGALAAVVLTSMVVVKNQVNKKVVKPFDVTSVFLPTNNKYPAIFKLTRDGRAFCSATVLTKTLALTAAHCVVMEGPFGLVNATGMVARSLRAADGSVLKVNTEVINANPRGDYALLSGDFSKFSTLQIDDRPSSDILYNKYNLITCGFPWGGTGVCYRIMDPEKYVDFIKAKGQMYAGMSGGPVIDMNTGTIYGTNTGVTDGFVIIAPIVNIFELLGR